MTPNIPDSTAEIFKRWDQQQEVVSYIPRCGRCNQIISDAGDANLLIWHTNRAVRPHFLAIVHKACDRNLGATSWMSLDRFLRENFRQVQPL